MPTPVVALAPDGGRGTFSIDEAESVSAPASLLCSVNAPPQYAALLLRDVGAVRELAVEVMLFVEAAPGQGTGAAAAALSLAAGARTYQLVLSVAAAGEALTPALVVSGGGPRAWIVALVERGKWFPVRLSLLRSAAGSGSLSVSLFDASASVPFDEPLLTSVFVGVGPWTFGGHPWRMRIDNLRMDGDTFPDAAPPDGAPDDAGAVDASGGIADGAAKG